MRRTVGRPGPYALQAAIAACHAVAPSWADTDWPEIARLYEILESVQPGPVVRLNRAVAVAEVDGPDAALAIVDGIEGLDRFHRHHIVRAELLRRVDRTDEARASYRAALALEPSDPEARHLARRLAELAGG